MSSLCAYRDILGRPRIGIHEARTRFGDMASNDVLMTCIGAVILTVCIASLSGFFSKKHRVGSLVRLFLVVSAWLFLTGVLLHRIFCVRTTIDEFLFP